MEEKLANARLLIQQKKVEMPVLVDGMDEAAHRRFGRLPNMVYVIDLTGRIVYKSMWTRHQELREFLRELLQTRDENRNDQKQAAFS
ncbi:MAG: TlpA family protein disulfide reductase [Acidiferrobacterales bacterium]